MHKKRFYVFVIIAALILLIPLIAMQFTNEVHWQAFDFIVAGSMLLISGFLIEVTLQKVNNPWYRIAACTVILLVLLLVWAQLAVGIL